MAAPEEFDYVIVGAGSAGCVLANRLSADPELRVSGARGGPDGPQPLRAQDAGCVLRQPLKEALQLVLPQRARAAPQWAQPLLSARSGGGRLVVDQRHGFLARQPARLRRLGRQLAARMVVRALPCHTSSAWKAPAAMRVDYRGGDGPIQTSMAQLPCELYDAYVEALQQAGYPFTDDVNGYQHEGVFQDGDEHARRRAL